MKKSLPFLSLLVFSICFGYSFTDISVKNTVSVSKSEKSFDNNDDAIAYNDQMIDIQIIVDNALVDFLDAIDTYNPETIKTAKAKTLAEIKKAQKAVSKMKKFNKNGEYKKAMLELISMYKDITDNELTKIISLVTSGNEMSEEDWSKYSALYDSALLKYNTAFDKFNAWQDGFAAEYDFTVNRGEE
jgi:hypothetical protein